MGTPTEETWPGVNKLPDFKKTFPKWTKNRLDEMAGNLCKKGKDLLRKMLAYNPADRITAADALNHVKIFLYLLNVFSLILMILIKRLLKL
jgi:serine/threonine protein kinase